MQCATPVPVSRQNADIVFRVHRPVRQPAAWPEPADSAQELGGPAPVKRLAPADLVRPWLQVSVSAPTGLPGDSDQRREQLGVVERNRGRAHPDAAHRERARVVVAADGSFARRDDLGAALREPDRVDTRNAGQGGGDVGLEDGRAAAHNV
jgi:hypothetical protein